MKNFFLLTIALVYASGAFAFPNRAKMLAKIGDVPKTIEESVFENPETGLPKLVRNVTVGAMGEAQKIRIIHDWICNTIAYDANLYFSGKSDNQDYVSVLKNRKALCTGYSSVFMEMCKLANIQAVRIAGWSKGFGYTGELGEKTDHEWNAVKIGASWYLIDCMWDAGYVDWKTFVKHYSQDWYMLPAEYFIYSHLPKDDAWQLLPNEKIRTKEQFVAEPYIDGKFFGYGFALGKNVPDYTTKIDGETKFDFTVAKQGIESSCILRDANTQEELKGFAWCDRSANTYTYAFDVPDRKSYTVEIFAKRKEENAYPDRFTKDEFDNDILARAHEITGDISRLGKTISRNDFELFENAFFFSRENNCYYFKEDQFNKARNNMVLNVFKILQIKNGYLEPVLHFNIHASETYGGAGFEKKYPESYTQYNATPETNLLSPLTGVLKRGKTYEFKIASNDYAAIAVTVQNKFFQFKKNGAGVFTLSYTVPDNADRIIIMGSKNLKNYAGLLSYDTE